MSRRSIIGILIFLILGIIGGTVALVVQRLGASTSSAENTPAPGSSLLPGSQNGTAQLSDPSGDTDNDGLSNIDELKWGANPNNPDTDGDGFKDGEEVLAGHNPTIAGPNDKLPDGFVPGENNNNDNPTGPLNITDVLDLVTPTPDPIALNPSSTPLIPDQYFAEGINLSGGSNNLTQQYFQQYNTTTITSSAGAFVKAQPLTTQLPTTYNSYIKVASSEDSNTIKQYVAAVQQKSVLSDQITLGLSINDLMKYNDPTRVSEQVKLINDYQQELLDILVPPSAVPVHKLILGYTELLKQSMNILKQWETDQIKALVAIRQLDAADRLYYPLIAQELNRLAPPPKPSDKVQ